MITPKLEEVAKELEVLNQSSKFKLRAALCIFFNNDWRIIIAPRIGGNRMMDFRGYQDICILPGRNGKINSMLLAKQLIEKIESLKNGE